MKKLIFSTTRPCLGYGLKLSPSLTLYRHFDTLLAPQHPNIIVVSNMKVLALFQKAIWTKSGKIRKTPFSSLSKFSTAVSLDDDYAFSDNYYETPRISSVLPTLPENSRRIYLLRHGETNWNAEGKIQGGGFDIPLNENGRAQAMAAARALEDIPLSLIASSPLSRAAETADLLAEGRGNYERILVPGLTEMSFGEFEGFPRRKPDICPKLKAMYHRIDNQCNENPEKAFPGGESAVEVAKRARTSFYQILDQFRDHKHIALVCHSRLNRILIAEAFLKDVRLFSTIQQGNSW
jgi:broad specificity phosphatase PhoE